MDTPTDSADRLFNWILAEYNSGSSQRPQLTNQQCKCGFPVETDGLALGFCRNHNMDCIIAFSNEVTVGAWSFKYLIGEIKKFAVGFRDDASNFVVSAPSSPGLSPPPYQASNTVVLSLSGSSSKWKEIPSYDASDSDTMPDHQLPNWDEINDMMEECNPG